MKDFFSWLILVPLSLGILTEAFESSPFLGFGMVVPVGGGTKERSKVFFVQPQKALSSSVSNGLVDRRRIRSHPHPGLAASDNDTADNNGNDAYDFNAAFRARKDDIEAGETVSGFSAQPLGDDEESVAVRRKSNVSPLLSGLFSLVVLAIVALNFRIALSPFFDAKPSNGDQEEEEIFERKQLPRNERPKSTIVDFGDLLKEP